MKTKTTKRRKVWVTFDGDDPAWVEGSAKMAKLQRLASESMPVPFIERRPGDVVLSQEDASAILNALNRTNRPDVVILRALLRGGR